MMGIEYSSTREVIHLLLKSKPFMIGLILVLSVSAIAISADYISKYSPLDFVGEPFTPPTSKYYLGTDDMGRDIYSMTVYGSRVSLIVGLTAAVLTTLLGMSIGIISGMNRGIIDAIIMRIIDFLLAIPYLVIALSILAFLKPNLFIIILIIAVLGWISTAKVVRAQTITVMESAFVESAEAIGASQLHIALKYVIPNVIHVVLSSLVLNVRDAILFEASLSFLGFGDPRYVSWGTMLFFARRGGAFAAGAWWCIIPPGLMIMITVLGFTLMAVGLDEVLNPRLRKI